MNRETLLSRVAELVQTDLKPLVQDIDRKGLYPEDFLRKLGGIGGFAAVGTTEEGGSGLGLFAQIEVLREVGKACGATAFSAWCQAACAWYLHQTPNAEVKRRYLSDVLNGKVLAGTGMSNTVKHLAGIEKHQLQAQKIVGGYTVSGILPWVSNLGENHIWANTAQIGGGYVMFITGGQSEGVSLIPCPEFCALEGTRTFAIKLKTSSCRTKTSSPNPNSSQTTSLPSNPASSCCKSASAQASSTAVSPKSPPPTQAAKPTRSSTTVMKSWKRFRRP